MRLHIPAAIVAFWGLLVVVGSWQVAGAQTYTLSMTPTSGGGTMSNGSLSMTGNASGFPGPVLNLAGVAVSGTAGTGNDTGWRIFSLPVIGATRGDLSDDLDMNVSSGSILYSHDGTDYVAVSDDATVLPNGQGFLLYVFDDDVETIGSGGLALDVPGDPPSTDVTISSLGTEETWHLLGNPFDQSFDLSSLNLVAQGFQAAVQTWDPSTSSWKVITQESGTNDVIASWQGFFVERTILNEGESTLSFDYDGRTTGGTLVGGKRQASNPFRLGLTLEAMDNSGNVTAVDEGTSLYFTPDATSGWDAWDATKQKPPFVTSHYVQLAIAGERAGKFVNLSQRSHPEAWSGEATFPLVVHSVGESNGFRLSWPSLADVPEAWSLTLQDSINGTSIDLRETAEYLIDGPVMDGQLAIVISGAIGTGVHEQIPTEWALDAAYPNPFNPVTTLRFAVPETSSVSLMVYDVLGRRVAKLVDGTVAAGRHEARFDGTSLGSGVYLYVLTTPNGAMTRTVTLVK